MAADRKIAVNAIEIDRLATQLAKDPLSKAFLPLAEEYCKADMFLEAVSVLEDGLKHYPGYITAMVALGRAYDQLNQPSKARAVLEGAVKLSPDNLRAHRTLIKIYMAQGMTEEALKSCRVLLLVNPRDEEALSAQASLTLPVQTESERQPAPGPVLATTVIPSSVAQPPAGLSSTPEFALGGKLGVDFRGAASGDSSFLVTSRIVDEALQRSDSTDIMHHTDQNPSPECRVGAGDLLPHVAAVSKLESWLRSIQRRRRDRERSEDAGF